MAVYVVSAYHASISKACRIVSLPKSMCYYEKTKDDSAAIAKLSELADGFHTEGQDLFYSRLRFEGMPWNHKRVNRFGCTTGLV